MKLVATAAATLMMLGPLTPAASADHSPRADRYAACLIGTAAVEIRQYHNGKGGMEVAYENCADLAKGLSASEVDGVQEFAESVIASLSETDTANTAN